ncbi:MFS transporter [Virgibacillus sp. SK37]|uniref:MFS transporter n=1 Tax=Virgibacillus sp. SK37 TaxID=403957 RepID=UPI0004D0B7C3|nr:MFS transporter [Virgibacillus sp. SK37]AIF42586.1 hypothetical protein X953_04390 [Virgibacillus sp. SK37]
MYLSTLTNKNIRNYLLGGGVSRLGDVLSGMAFLFLAYDLTDSTIYTTIMAIAETIPYLLFGLIGGVIADWIPRKKLLILLDSLRIPIILSVFLFHQTGLLSFSYLLIVSFVIQTIGCFFNPAHRAILPMITQAEQRASANSLYDTVSRGVTILSPVLSVWLLTYGTVYFFIVDALSYGISIICLRKIHFTEEKNLATKTVRTAVLSIVEFFSWVRKHSKVKYLFTVTFLVVFFNTWVWQVGLLLALTELTSHSKELYSILQGVFGAIVVITNLIIPYFIREMTLKTYLIGAFLWGLGITYYGFMYSLTHFFIGVALVGIGLPLSSLARVYMLQTLVPENMHGRAFSSNAFLLYTANTVSLLLFGLLVIVTPIQWLMLGSGLMIIIISLAALTISSVKQSKFRWSSPIDFYK